MLRRRFVVLALLLAGASAHADGMLPPGAGELTFNRLFLHEDNQETPAEPKVDPDSIWNYFNLAHCVCSFFNYNEETTDPTFFEDTFVYEITIQNSTTALNRPIEFWVGADCASTVPGTRDENCTKVGALEISAIQQAGTGRIEIPIYDLMVPKPGERPGCQERLQASTTWGLVDGDADPDPLYEYSISDQIETDSEPPPLPTDFKALGAEEAIELSWEPPIEGVADIAFYQALCASTQSGAPGKTAALAPRYQTARQLCGASQDVPLIASVIDSNTDLDAGTGSITLPEDLAKLSPSYICGESLASTATSMRIDGLKNGTDYTVVLLAIDKYGNASGTYFTSSLTPQPAIDFWEDLHDRGSGVEGGFCLLAQAYGDNNPLTQSLRNFRDETLVDSVLGRALIDAYYGTVGSLNLHGSIVLRAVVAVVLLPVVAVALLWHLLTLPGLILLALLAVAIRRRKRLALVRWAAAPTMLALIVLAPGRASAQSPYWENNTVTEDTSELAIGDPARVQWHAGLRLGPYVPGIDAQLGMPIAGTDGPYEQMFGGYSILPMIDIERFFFTRIGQLGAGISIGYMGKKARPWQTGSDPADPDRPRSAGDENTFRLLPFSLNAVYRFSYLDDEFGIPLVPYARAGLAYYIWWVSAPNGDFAKTCVDGSDSTMCETTKARGASLGFVGSVGLAIRAERIDTAAARSMRESGIEHAGFYAEYSLGKVDGFGSDKKLSVGDATWFAGVDFEF